MRRHARARVAAAALCTVIVAGGAIADPEKSRRPAIEDLDVRTADGAYRVSFRVTGAFPSDVVELIESGVEVSFRHRVDVVSRRGFPWIGSRSLVRCEVVTTVTYDSLIRQYHLSRSLEFEPAEGEAPDPDEHDTDDVEEVRAWMTELRDVRVPVPTATDGRKPRKLRVQTNLGRRFVLLLFPAPREATAEFVLES